MSGCVDCSDCAEENHSLSYEAELAVKFIKFGVKEAIVSNKLPKSDGLAYLNIQTLEDKKYCVKLTLNGYQVVSFDYDTINDTISEQDEIKSETIDALLNTISPLYVKKFSESLAEKLKTIE